MNAISSKDLRVPVYQAITSILPRPIKATPLLMLGELLRILHFLGRQFRIIRYPENFVLMGAGSLLNMTAGQIPGVRYSAKAVFLCLSVVKCSEDLLELHRLLNKIQRCFFGTAYVPLEKNKLRTPTMEEQLKWQNKIYEMQIQLAFVLIGDFFKRFLLLALHLSDIYAALKEDHVIEVFVYSKKLLNKAISGDAILLQKLRQNETIHHRILEKLGVKIPFNIMLKVLEVPVAIQQKLPASEDVQSGLKRKLKHSIHKIEAVTEHHLQALEEIGILSKSEEGRVYMTYQVGSSEDPQAHRFITSIQKNHDSKRPKSDISV